MAVADRLTDRERRVLTRLVRTGGPDEFGAPTPYITRPSGQRYQDRPVYVLTNDGTASAGDVQTLMLSRLPNVTQVGEPTFGMFSKFTRGLPNGWVMSTTNERFLSMDGVNYEYQGIAPEIAVHNTVAALNAGDDLILQAALDDFGRRLPIKQGSVPVSAAMSGSWFAPDHDGEGFVLEILNESAAVVYWFTYSPQAGRQAWMIAVGNIEGDRIRFEDVLLPVGARWGDEFAPDDVVMHPWGGMEIRFTACHRAVVSYEGDDAFGANYQTVQRLLAHDGLDCGGALGEAANGISGSWYDPERDGEGWVLSQLPDGRAVMFWFTYDHQGESLWLIGVGNIEDNLARFDEVLEPLGGQFGPAFDPASVTMQPWGSMTMEFTGCDEAQVAWTPSSAPFDAGQRTATRLTSLAGLVCP